MTDHLRALPVQQVAAWYRRLADLVAAKTVGGETPYAAILLRHWLDNRNPRGTFMIRPRPYLWSSPHVLAVLRYHRAVFLTQQDARVGRGGAFGAATRRAGVVPRIAAEPGFTRWVLPGRLQLEYQSLVEIGGGPLDILRIQQNGSAGERDLFTALRGFQLRSSVLVQGARAADRASIRFVLWKCDILDRYDWNYSEYLTMPNPDFGRAAADSVRPGDRSLTVYHRNAKRLEDARLAAPYDVRSVPWDVLNREITAPATVTL